MNYDMDVLVLLECCFFMNLIDGLFGFPVT
jgi:hypothetical protein